ncbi:hypothetical protein [Microbacterium sp. R86528]|uniref:hypothetical protein n=1 Tax=Microbacterium sp. R86528 TaxID=3093864 RepID=UPI0037C6FA23
MAVDALSEKPGSDSSLPDHSAGRLTPPPSSRSRRRVAIDLSLLAVVGVVLVGAVAAAYGAVQREFYSPTAFVEQYLSMLEEGRTSDALSVPGVAVASADLEAAGLPPTAHDALLRSTALATLTDAHVVSEEQHDHFTTVNVAYTAGGYAGTTSFDVEEDGAIGIAPTWRFASSPLAVLSLNVGGSMSFNVNGFALDKRQVSPEGVDADPTEAVSLLVFSPGLYSVSVETAIATTPGVAVLSDSPFTSVPVTVQAQPTEEFVEVVQERVEEFLSTCASQEVLQPTACPFGYVVEDRIASIPEWQIETQPTISIESDGADWKIPATPAAARLNVDIQSLFDGSITTASEVVPFFVTGTIRVLPDGSVTISVGGTEGE